MNFRISFILIILVGVVGSYVFLFELQRSQEITPSQPWFYDVEFTDIIQITIVHKEDEETFAINTDYEWIFKDTGQKVDADRWGGIPLLLSGPRTSRTLLESYVDNPTDYGLDNPESLITLTIKDGRQIGVVLGNKTPDGSAHYAQRVGSDALFLVTSSWGDTLNRLVTHPPVLPTNS